MDTNIYTVLRYWWTHSQSPHKIVPLPQRTATTRNNNDTVIRTSLWTQNMWGAYGSNPSTLVKADIPTTFVGLQPSGAALLDVITRRQQRVPYDTLTTRLPSTMQHVFLRRVSRLYDLSLKLNPCTTSYPVIIIIWSNILHLPPTQHLD